MYAVIAVFNSLSVRVRSRYTQILLLPQIKVWSSTVHCDFPNALYKDDKHKRIATEYESMRRQQTK